MFFWVWEDPPNGRGCKDLGAETASWNKKAIMMPARASVTLSVAT
jgi:hypothetical protein